MLKLACCLLMNGLLNQPPSGGCVLKLENIGAAAEWLRPAAFGRLCVETAVFKAELSGRTPAAFGRLCVETASVTILTPNLRAQPPSGGCVLKQNGEWVLPNERASRLRAAVC